MATYQQNQAFWKCKDQIAQGVAEIKEVHGLDVICMGIGQMYKKPSGKIIISPYYFIIDKPTMGRAQPMPSARERFIEDIFAELLKQPPRYDR